MGKTLKSGKVVIVVSGRYAGRKAIILKNYDYYGTAEKQYKNILIAGINRYPGKVHKGMENAKIHNRLKIKVFIEMVNCNQLLPTHYSVDFVADQKVVPKDWKDPAKRNLVRFRVRMMLEERYYQGKHKWFFQKLRF